MLDDRSLKMNFLCFLGYVELSYQFASFIAFGTYKIRCEAQQSTHEKSFLVDFFCMAVFLLSGPFLLIEILF